MLCDGRHICVPIDADLIDHARRAVAACPRVALILDEDEPRAH
jgi:hypothetical protein